MAHRNAFHGAAEQGGGIFYFDLSNKGHSQAAAHRLSGISSGHGFRIDGDAGLCNFV